MLDRETEVARIDQSTTEREKEEQEKERKRSRERKFFEKRMKINSKKWVPKRKSSK
tara:strand:+ start:1100 stop:1267 length:168 start_codon:yes stop_codon:yes gene_type:complete